MTSMGPQEVAAAEALAILAFGLLWAGGMLTVDGWRRAPWVLLVGALLGSAVVVRLLPVLFGGH
jgi:hypothetical protein